MSAGIVARVEVKPAGIRGWEVVVLRHRPVTTYAQDQGKDKNLWPVGAEVGDTWVVTDAVDDVRRYDGSQWVKVRVSGGQLATDVFGSGRVWVRPIYREVIGRTRLKRSAVLMATGAARALGADLLVKHRNVTYIEGES